MWDQLPELILIQIFSYLSRADRANVNQICSLWSSALSAPILWRSVTVLLDRDLIGDHPITIDLVPQFIPNPLNREMNNFYKCYSNKMHHPLRSMNSYRKIMADMCTIWNSLGLDQISTFAIDQSCRWM